MKDPRVKFVVDDDGWLIDTRHLRSPNQDARPPGTTISALVVHGITLPPGHFGHGHVDRLFANTLDAEAYPFFAGLVGLCVSAHLLVTRTGRVTQYVGFDDRAWHAGASRLAGRERVNDFGIGIELEGADHCAYAPAQYRVLAALADVLMTRYPALSRDRIVGHSDIAPGRKTDPGPAFDWATFDRLLAMRRSR